MPRKKKEVQKRRQNKRRTVRKPIENLEARTEGQKAYLDLIRSCDAVICDGPAGTGKTLLAVGAALDLMHNFPEKYRRLIMVRPAITVRDEEIGFLPGDIDDKMRPFMAPIMDSMSYFLQQSEIASLLETGVIEVIPISYMRGRTFNNCILIFDEAQNSTPEQMKMVLTRIGFSSKIIIEGDVSQSDLDSWEARSKNGLRDAIHRFGHPTVLEGFGVAELESKDVVRSPVVRRLLTRYES